MRAGETTQIKGSRDINNPMILFLGGTPMQKQTVQFAVTRNNGAITRVGRTGILQPKTNFKGGSVKWYEDKPKQKSK